VVVIEEALIASLKVAVTFVPTPTSIAPPAGEVAATVGAVVSRWTAVAMSVSISSTVSARL
jgi:hypothetical protein